MIIFQISDIHISVFRDDNRIQEFREFATKTIDAIRPKVVLASGDLTDGKDKVAFGSRQYEDEWKTYGDIVNESKVRDRTLWMDIRGNHGNVTHISGPEVKVIILSMFPQTISTWPIRRPKIHSFIDTQFREQSIAAPTWKW